MSAYRLPEGDLWTETLVARGLVEAWREHPRTTEAAAFLNLIPLLLVSYPDERSALHLRSYSFARLSIASLPDLLRANGLSRSTFEDRWRRGIKILTRELNIAQGRGCNDNTPDNFAAPTNKPLDDRKRCAGKILA